jgi:1-acyl-sn-glycerol-3-phosphate acyltransferase
VTRRREDSAVHVVAAAIGYPLALVLFALALPVQAVLLAVTFPFDRNRAVAGRFLRFVGVGLSLCFPPWRVRVEGRWPGAGPYVVVANHQSILDILLLSRLPREMKWVAKDSLFRIPWAGWMLRMAGDIPVRRGDAESGGEAMARARRYLARGMNVMIFPEGTRSTTAALLPFKAGAFRLAVEAGVPVLPVAVSGTGAGMPKGGPWVNPCRAVARILEPIPTADLDAGRVRDLARTRIAAAVEDLRSVTTAPEREAGPTARDGRR